MEKVCREAHAPKSVEGKAAGGGEEKPVSLRLPGLSLADNLPAGSSFPPGDRKADCLRLSPSC